MRQQPHLFREWQIRRSAPRLLDTSAAITLICGGTGFVLAHVGAFDTSAVSAVVRFPYFVGLSLAAAVPAAVLTQLGDRWQFRRLPEPAHLLVLAALLTLFLTPLVWVAAALVLNGDPSPARLLPLSGQVAPVAAVLFLLQRLVARPLVKEKVAPSTNHSNLVRRLPAELRAAGITAISAEDHYLRVHTPAGSALILMRFADALQAVKTLDGAQTHRSWWVARGAVLAVKRSDGRASLSLVSGLEVPVSRAHARRLRELGWF